MPDAEHVFRRHLAAQQLRVQVRDDPPLALLVAVRAHVETGSQQLAVAADQAHREGVFERYGRESGLGLLRGLRAAEEEQPDEGAEVSGVAARPVRQLRLVAAEGGVRGAAEDREDAVGVVLGPLEGFAEAGTQVVGELGSHERRSSHACALMAG